MKPEKIRPLTVALIAIAVLLASCNMPGEQADQLADQLNPPPTATESADLQSPDVQDPIFASVEASELIVKGPQCQPEGLQITAAMQADDSAIASVSMRYRLQGELPDQTSDWFEFQLSDQGVVNDQVIFMADLPDLGGQAMALFDDGWGMLEYQLEAVDGVGNSSTWPTDEPLAELGVAPCPLATELTILDGSLEPQQAEYGTALGCEPTIATFGLTLENAETLDEAWVSVRWYVGDFESGDYEPVSPPTKLTLLPAGPSGEYPGATVFATNVDIQQGGQMYLKGLNGFLAWRMRVKDQEGTVGEWPLGDAPPIFITACTGSITLNPTATQGAILILPTATPTAPLQIAPQPTATLGLELIPGELLQASGRDVVIEHALGFDFDSGMVVNPKSDAADFAMNSGDDAYIDVMQPLNGSYVGWYGEEAPSKADCNILKASAAMPIGWPEQQGSYYCFETSDGRVAWLQLETYVSLPLSERRMIFHFKTFK